MVLPLYSPRHDIHTLITYNAKMYTRRVHAIGGSMVWDEWCHVSLVVLLSAMSRNYSYMQTFSGYAFPFTPASCFAPTSWLTPFSLPGREFLVTMGGSCLEGQDRVLGEVMQACTSGKTKDVTTHI